MIVGYGVCGKGEAKKYLKKTLDCFERLTDKTIILLNNAGKEEKELIKSYGFLLVEDNREWGKHQWKMKQDFLKDHVAKLDPDYSLCLDMDEVVEESTTKEDLITYLDKYQAIYCYLLNLWGNGYNKEFSFFNVRAFSWKNKDKLGDDFFQYEQKNVHCGLAPKWTYALHKYAPFIVLHYGLKVKADREKRIERYKKYDPEQTKVSNPRYYEALASTKFDKLNLDEVKAWLIKEVEEADQPESVLNEKKATGDRVLVKRQSDGMVFDIPKDRLKNQLQQRQMVNGQWYGFEQV